MLGLLVAISAVACYAGALSITNVTLPDRSAGWVYLRYSPDPTWVNRIEFRCEYSISPAPATPPTITWLKHPADCAQFYTCSGGLSYGTNTCPAGLVFNQDLQLCDWANNVICL
uniref:chitinase n=1 Tax=Branchiostoma floridae TaxID=7739 RepID=C3YS91_BRAFL|eukprot:XP_002600984.1 hypothetical protein BRAFLDRAFT_96983 [Branchiostoma floridae]